MINLTKEKLGIEPVDNPDKVGSIYIPDQAQGRSNQGIVKYKGADTDEFEIGDYVLFSPYNGTLVILEDEGRIIIVNKDFVTCKIDPPTDLQNTEIPGLYFKEKRVNEFAGVREEVTNYFPATYEVAMEMIAKMCANSNFRKTNKVYQRSVQDERANFRKNEGKNIDWSKDR